MLSLRLLAALQAAFFILARAHPTQGIHASRAWKHDADETDATEAFVAFDSRPVSRPPTFWPSRCGFLKLTLILVYSRCLKSRASFDNVPMTTGPYCHDLIWGHSLLLTFATATIQFQIDAVTQNRWCHPFRSKAVCLLKVQAYTWNIPSRFATAQELKLLEEQVESENLIFQWLPKSFFVQDPLSRGWMYISIT